jgi:hypothetical protein
MRSGHRTHRSSCSRRLLDDLQLLRFAPRSTHQLLNKTLIGQTKSQPGHFPMTTDWGVQEPAVIRKHIGYGHVAAPHARATESFFEKHFNPNLKFHRHRRVPEQSVDPKGTVKRVDRWYATPRAILRQLGAGHNDGSLEMLAHLTCEREGRTRRFNSADRSQRFVEAHGTSGRISDPATSVAEVDCPQLRSKRFEMWNEVPWRLPLRKHGLPSTQVPFCRIVRAAFRPAA